MILKCPVTNELLAGLLGSTINLTGPMFRQAVNASCTCVSNGISTPLTIPSAGYDLVAYNVLHTVVGHVGSILILTPFASFTNSPFASFFAKFGSGTPFSSLPQVWSSLWFSNARLGSLPHS